MIFSYVQVTFDLVLETFSDFLSKILIAYALVSSTLVNLEIFFLNFEKLFKVAIQWLFSDYSAISDLSVTFQWPFSDPSVTFLQIFYSGSKLNLSYFLWLMKGKNLNSFACILFQTCQNIFSSFYIKLWRYCCMVLVLELHTFNQVTQ